MASHMNSVLLSGPLSNVKVIETQYGSMVKGNLASVSINLNLDKNKEHEKNLLENIATSQSAYIYDGTLSSQQDKKDPQKIWHNINVSPSRIWLTNQQVEIINMAWIVGKVVQTNANWITVACSYRVKEEWRNRILYVLGQADMTHTKNATIIATGPVRPKYNGNWFTYVEAERIVVME